MIGRLLIYLFQICVKFEGRLEGGVGKKEEGWRVIVDTADTKTTLGGRYTT